MSKRIQIIAAAVLTVCLFLCGFYLSASNTGNSQMESPESSQAETRLFSSRPGVSPIPATPEVKSIPQAASSIAEPEIFDPVQQMTDNPNCIGWLSIAGDGEEIPVMQTIDDPEYYRTHDFNMAESDNSPLYLDSRCGVYESDNRIVYGGHVQNDIFTFRNYTAPEYWQENPAFMFTDAYERVQYTVFAVLTVFGPVTETEKNLFDLIDFADEQDFDEWIRYMQEKSLYDAEIKPVYGDRFMMISFDGDKQANSPILIIGYAEKHIHER